MSKGGFDSDVKQNVDTGGKRLGARSTDEETNTLSPIGSLV